MLLSILGIITVKTPAQLNSLAIQTYIFGAIVGLACVFIATIIAKAIKFEGGSNPKDPGKRRLWFWLLFFLSFAGFFLYNMLIVSPTIASNLQSKFTTTNLIGSVISAAAYFIAGFVLSKMFPTGKLGSWFSSKQ
jgi:uncharacterized membrane protein